ncbi:hypothetical protein EGW08_004122 [Elysia chlorotica]|uniref:Uncharacterized protein n=1 Tax=Elysia chlorotica TaxID=188477 RepID=A0A3S1BT03_ELYCH|nr:hypothetical protein EGW08_004122 [Elysia chlorotica]
MSVSSLLLVITVGTQWADCALSPVNLWPLTNISFAWDAVLDKDASHPDKNHCPEWLAVEQEGEGGGLEANAWVCGGHLHDGGPSVGFQAATFAFLLYLKTVTSGIVFEYKRPCAALTPACSIARRDLDPSVTPPDAVDGLVLELQVCAPHARLYDADGSLVNSVTSSVPVTLATWTWVAVTWNGTTGHLGVQVGPITTQQPLPAGESYHWR